MQNPARCRFPDHHLEQTGRRRQLLTVRGPGEATDAVAVVRVQAASLLGGRSVPESHHALAATGGHRGAVRRYGHGHDHVLMTAIGVHVFAGGKTV